MGTLIEGNPTTKREYRAVLFDWVGTLVHYRRGSWRLRRAHEKLGRQVDDEGFRALVSDIVDAYGHPIVERAMATEDCSPEQHRFANMLWYEHAGMDRDLAEAAYGMEFDPETHPVFPDSRDVLRRLHVAGIRNAVVSNFHRDLRPAMRDHGLAEYVDAVVISSEHGFQKPDRRMFKVALKLLGVKAGEALMVGDSPTHDGAAAELGIDTLLVSAPAEDVAESHDLNQVLRLVGIDQTGWPT